MQLHHGIESRKDSNFPLSSFQTGHASSIARNYVESAKEQNEKVEPEVRETHLLSTTAPRPASIFSANKRRSQAHTSLGTQQRNTQPSRKELSQETLVIGGLVKQKSTSMIRNKSALSKEYHQRHTRHIRGQSAVTKLDGNRKNQRVRQSLQSTKVTQKSISNKESMVGKSETQQVPNSVLEWYNEMIGVPTAGKQRVLPSEASVLDYEVQRLHTQPGPRSVSSYATRPRSKVGKSVQKQTARVAKVGQQPPFMTLN